MVTREDDGSCSKMDKLNARLRFSTSAQIPRILLFPLDHLRCSVFIIACNLSKMDKFLPQIFLTLTYSLVKLLSHE